MNEKTWAMYARIFEGVATIGNFSPEDGLLTVHVWPTENNTLPALDAINRALAIGDEIESRLGVTVIVKGETRIPQRALGA